MQNLNSIMTKYYSSGFYKIMDSLEFISMHFKMQHMRTYLEHYHEDCESPAELLLYDSLIRVLRKAPDVQFQWDCSNKKKYRLDFTYVSKIAPVIFAIEVDGVIYHSCRIEKDKLRDEALARDNVIVIRVTGKFIYKDPIAAAQEVAQKITSYHKEFKEKSSNKLIIC